MFAAGTELSFPAAEVQHSFVLQLRVADAQDGEAAQGASTLPTFAPTTLPTAAARLL